MQLSNIISAAHCPASCMNDGVCTTPGNCNCFDGWIGDDCSIGGNSIVKAQLLAENNYYIAVSCPSLSDPANGTMICSLGDDGSSTFQDTCNFTCTAGYKLSGSSTRTCQSNGSWSNNEPVCNRGGFYQRYRKDLVMVTRSHFISQRIFTIQSTL